MSSSIRRTHEWFVYIPEEGDWPVYYDGKSHAGARSAYLKWANRKKLPPGAVVWRREPSHHSVISRLAAEIAQRCRYGHSPDQIAEAVRSVLTHRLVRPYKPKT